jgi:hypothetical protein
MGKQRFLEDVIEVLRQPRRANAIYHKACYRPEPGDKRYLRIYELMVDRQCEACCGWVSKSPQAARVVQQSLWE